MQPPQYPYPPAQPPKRSAWQRFRTLGCGWQSLIGCMSICVLVFFAVLCPFAASSFVHGWNAASITPTIAPTASVASQSVIRITTNTPTAKSNPTATKVPAQPTPTSALSTGPALLGSDISTFDATYGPRDPHTDVANGSYHYQKYGDSNIDFLIVGTDIFDVGVYHDHVEDISAQADNGGWTSTLANQKCSVFYPADAVYKEQIPVANGPAIDKIYYSASLAKLFPASAFTDANQNPVKAGYFDVQFLYEGSAQTTFAGCDIIIGEQQTK